MLQSPFGFVVGKVFKASHANDLSLDDKFFLEALEQAFHAVGRTYPNPPVGSVIVKDDQIVGRGYTSPAGGSHAEINALSQAKFKAFGATLFTTMEPCHHFGRTPPCTRAIIEAGIKKVVIGVSDPNPEVNGKGIQCLVDARLEVLSRKPDILNEQAKALILPFKKNVQTRKPWVVCKISTSLDGKITKEKGEKTNVSNKSSHLLVHQLRNVVDAVMVGSNTVLVDNPKLNVRGIDAKNVQNPLRVVLDGFLKTPTDKNVYDQIDGLKTCVVYTNLADADKIQKFAQRGIKLLEVEEKEGHVSVEHALRAVSKMGVTSLLVECGAQLFSQFLKEKQFDEIWWFVSPKIFGGKGQNSITDELGHDLLPELCWSDPVLLEDDVLFVGHKKG